MGRGEAVEQDEIIKIPMISDFELKVFSLISRRELDFINGIKTSLSSSAFRLLILPPRLRNECRFEHGNVDLVTKGASTSRERCES